MAEWNIGATLVEVGIPAAVCAGLGIRFYRRAQHAAAGMLYGSGLFMATEAVLHTAFNLVGRAIHLTKAVPGAEVLHIFGFEYDFRFYALMMLGSLLFYASLGMVRAARAIDSGQSSMADARRGPVLLMLVLVVPLLPFVPHAYWFTGLTLINLAVLSWRRGAVPQQMDLAEAVSES